MNKTDSKLASYPQTSMGLKPHNRKFLILALMCSSILLLLLLQFLWIKSEYKAAEDSFRKETNLVFKHTVSGLIDSLFMTRVELIRESDSTPFKSNGSAFPGIIGAMMTVLFML